MYPASFFAIFPPFPQEKKVFVAMSFDEPFQRRWKDVIEPAVSSIKRDGVELEAVRVNVRRISDSIVTEILQGISQDLVVFADVTTLGYAGKKPIRNAGRSHWTPHWCTRASAPTPDRNPQGDPS